MLQKTNRDKVLTIFFDNPIPHEGGFQLREISRTTNIAPTSVKNYLKELKENNLIIQKTHRVHKYPTYYGNRDNEYFKFLKKQHTIKLIHECKLINYIFDNCTPKSIILFGSASRGDDTIESDIDLFVESQDIKLNLKEFNKQINRPINIHFSKNLRKLNNELKSNIINGTILYGYIDLF